jgi:phosphotransferase system  glucose/maltose/N-acetylglucosamine-specific IIC component
MHLNRSALLLLNNIVYVAFAAHADQPPFHGWVFGYDAATLAPAGVHVTTPVPLANGGGGGNGGGCLASR